MGDPHQAPALAHAELSATLAPLPPGLVAEPLGPGPFGRELARQLENVRRFGPEGALVRLDVDRLADVAPAEAPRVTSAVVRALVGVLRPADVLGRIGPDDFVILLPRADVRDAALTADALLSAIHDTPDLFEEGVPRVTVSAGVMLFDRADLTVSQALAEAESALFEAKDAGPGRIAIATARDRDSSAARAATHRDDRWRLAILDGSFALYGQPVRERESRRIVSIEALARLDLGGAPVEATDFLPVAERWGLAGAVDAWVLAEVARRLARHPDLPLVSINLSGSSLADPSFARIASQTVAAHGTAPSRIAFEVAEVDVLSAPVVARRAVERLRMAGFAIVLDAVADGTCSLGRLAQPPTMLKLAPELVVRAAGGPVEAVVVRGVVEVAARLGSRSVATRLADDTLIAVANSLGTDYVQGYAVGPPEPFEEIEARRSADLATHD